MALLLLATEPSLAAGEPDAQAVRLEVRSQAGCASRADLITRVLARAPRVRFADDGESLSIRVKVEVSRPGEVVGEVALTKSDAKPWTRRVVASTCEEASDAVALIVAVALGYVPSDTGRTPDAAADGSPGGTSGQGEQPSTNPGGAAAGTADKSPALVAPKPESTEPRAKDTNGPDTESSTPDESDSTASISGLPVASRGRFGVHVAAQSFFGPAPDFMLGLALYATLALDREAPLSPALVLGLTRAWRSGVEAQGGTAAFTLDAVTLDACFLRYELARFEARVCGSALGGRLSAEGSNTNNPAGTIARPFWVLGGAASSTFAITRRFELSARLSAGGNLVKDEFVFEPYVFHQVPDVTVAASLGAGVRWP